MRTVEDLQSYGERELVEEIQVLERELLKERIERARDRWKIVAQENGWYFEPFYIHVWIKKDDHGHMVVSDSVAHKGMEDAGGDMIDELVKGE